jgi:hypothetical protein
MSVERWWNDTERRKTSVFGGGGTSPTATLRTTNIMRNGAGSNPGLRGERPATDPLRHGTAYTVQ